MSYHDHVGSISEMQNRFYIRNDLYLIRSINRLKEKNTITSIRAVKGFYRMWYLLMINSLSNLEIERYVLNLKKSIQFNSKEYR